MEREITFGKEVFMANKEEGLKKQRFETLKDKHMMLWQLAYRMDELSG